MAKLLKLRRGTTTQHGSFTGAEGEVTVDTTKDTLVVHDGSTQGGHPVAAEDMANVSSSSIVGRIGSSALAGAKVQPNFGSQNVETTGTLSSGAHAVTGNITVSGTVDGVDLANLNLTMASLSSVNGSLATGVTATTPSSSDNSTKVATTAYVTTAVSNLVDGAPAALNTLNELAAAIGDDASFSTTMTNSLNTKLATNGNGSSVTNLNASNISSGTIADARLPNTISSDITGTAAVASAVTVTGTNSNVTLYPLFTTGTGNQTVYNDGGGGLSFNASSNVLSAGTFSGSGASLTSLNASNISSGTISSSRIPTLNQNTTGSSGSCSGNAATATKLANARTIAGVSFDGTGNISLNNNSITNGAGYTTFSSNQATNNGSNVTFGTINCSSLTATGNVTAYSDATLKKDVSTINDALGMVGKLRGVTYKWISNEQEDIGVIAQEVEEVIPEVIKETEDGIKTVDYARLVSVLINAVNELKAEVDELKGGK